MISITNLGIRLASILPKLFLSLIIIKNFTIENVGYYNLFSTSIIVLTFILGFDFYVYSNRKLVGADDTEKSTILLRQLLFYCFTYVIILPISFLFLKEKIPIDLLSPFYIILITEHLSQEIYRVINILERQLVASVLLAIRNSIWILLCLTYTIVFQNNFKPSFELLLVFWSVGGIISLFMSILVIRKLVAKSIKLIDLTKVLNAQKWYSEAMYTSSLFFAMTFSYKFIEYGGRYFIVYFHEIKILGIYSIFYQISSLISIFFEATILTFLYPKLLRFYQQNKKYEFEKEVKSTFSKIVYISIFLISVISATQSYIFALLGKEFLVEFKIILLILLVGNAFFMASNLYHYSLYSMEADKIIVKSTVLAFAFNVVITLAVLPIAGIYSVAIGSSISYFMLYILKSHYSRKSLDLWQIP